MGSFKKDALTDYALQKVLKDAEPIFGTETNVSTIPTERWMSKYADDVPIVRMNIPGTHDSATWNYTLETQAALAPVSALLGLPQLDPTFYQCQSISLASMLSKGIRAFDLRYAFDATKSTLVFWHGSALLSETATVEDVLYAFYNWLDTHPSEALFLSFQLERDKNSTDTQKELHRILSSPVAKHYINSAVGVFGTLGEARGKITLLKRFVMDTIPNNGSLPGLDFSPPRWTDNSETPFVLEYSSSGRAWIEDYYQPRTAINSTASEDIQIKFDAVQKNLRSAAGGDHPNDFFWTFTSATKILNSPSLRPVDFAQGKDGAKGINEQLLTLLKELKGKRLGVVMMDFFHQPEGLVETLLGL
ncbi:PLC-like phosphodiesterase [Piedraia hortae CBS 480.64]|uniref:PLC-like phosphodiesterase n=1 Tax=Piedraia hortae CBS 480.64 TaxID=1314780 RepID=A0A6A7BRP4_9PEZI|nr:PLC-like phosphodiesterase [Piedraia hortae CBS 480.64]